MAQSGHSYPCHLHRPDAFRLSGCNANVPTFLYDCAKKCSTLLTKEKEYERARKSTLNA